MSVDLRKNWKLINSLILELDKKINIPINCHTPINKLEDAIDSAKAITAQVKRRQINQIGTINIDKLMTSLTNKLEGVKYGLRIKELDINSIQPILVSAKLSLNPIKDELSVRIHKQKLNRAIQSAVGSNTVTQTHSNLTDAMQSYVVKSKSTTGIDKNASRDLLHMAHILERNTEDLNSMKSNINSTSTEKIKGQQFYVIYGPVLTGATLDPNKLRAAKVDFDVVYFPGIKYGFARKEQTPRFFVLRNQLLIAVMMHNTNRFRAKLKGKSVQQKLEEENNKLGEISASITTLMESKLDTDFIQIGAERNKYITNKEFSGIKFILLMEKSLYNKIGPFSSSNTLDLPF